MVYTMCKTESDLVFVHSEMNKLIGLDKLHTIPYVCFDNPLHHLKKRENPEVLMERF
jgi:hypothetical protein